MADPIVISDDSDAEWNSGYTPWRPPPPLDLNPGPSIPQVSSTTSLAAPMTSLLTSPLGIPLSSPTNSDLSLGSLGSHFPPGACPSSDFIDLTEESDAQPGDPMASGQASQCRTFQAYLSPVSSCCNSHASLNRSRSATYSRDLSSTGSFHQGSDAAFTSTSSSSSNLVAVPCVLENFYQVVFDSTEERRTEPIPQDRLQIIINTIEANFPEATLQCLTEFVTPHFYPPKEIITHVIRKILLNPEATAVAEETYNLLNKIQEMHPATLTYVVWDWELVTFVMQEQEEELPGQIFFLRYVVKTLEDDFKEVLKQPLGQMQDTIASSVLSCDKQPHNIKDIVRWLVQTVSGPTFPVLEQAPSDLRSSQAEAFPLRQISRKNNNQVVVLYLQKMLAIAVEVDRTPTCTSNKIAEMLFGPVLNIPERNQREAFFTSMESHLLRCKVLEIVLLHCCKKPPTVPLSFAQILYFLNNATSLYSQAEGIKWESWDELVEHLHFLLISYQYVLKEHLRTAIRDRQDVTRRFRQQIQHGDDITALDIEVQIERFRGRMIQLVGEIVPYQLQEKLFLLKLLFLRAIHGKPSWEGRFQGQHLMRAHTLLGQEYPSHE